MAEFALPPFLAVALLVEYAHHGLRIYAKGHFLDLDRLEELGSFLLSLLGGCLFFLTGSFLGGFAFLVGGLGLGGLGLDLGDFFLGLGAFFLWAKVLSAFG